MWICNKVVRNQPSLFNFENKAKKGIKCNRKIKAEKKANLVKTFKINFQPFLRFY